LIAVKTNQPYDIIGDIHGYADELHALFEMLGYEKRNGSHTHPAGRRVVFLGDYIDRGPKIREVLETVRAMVETGNALAILGNHEVNALWFHNPGPNGKPCAPTPRTASSNIRPRWTRWAQVSGTGCRGLPDCP
jgi:hypothetical protein